MYLEGNIHNMTTDEILWSACLKYNSNYSNACTNHFIPQRFNLTSSDRICYQLSLQSTTVKECDRPHEIHAGTRQCHSLQSSVGNKSQQKSIENRLQAFFHLHCVHHNDLFSMPYTLRHFRTSPFRDFLLVGNLPADSSRL